MFRVAFEAATFSFLQAHHPFFLFLAFWQFSEMPSGLPGITAPFFIRNALTDPAFHMELVLDALKRALPALPAFLQYKPNQCGRRIWTIKHCYFQRKKLCSSCLIHNLLLLQPFPEYLPILHIVETWCIIYQVAATGNLAKIFNRCLAIFVKHLTASTVSQVNLGEF